MTLPMLVSAEGEIVKALTAENLLFALGITDPRIAETDALAAFVDHADHFARLTKEAREIVSDEMVHRMDKRGKWTLHTGDLTVKSSSPAAGTETVRRRAARGCARDARRGGRDRRGGRARRDRAHPPAGARAVLAAEARRYPEPLKLGGRVAEAVLSAAVPTTPPRRSVKVSRTSARGSE
jgi:hypothetical protein